MSSNPLSLGQKQHTSPTSFSAPVGKSILPQPTDRLPHEIMLQIFSFLNIKDVPACATTCHTWELILQDEFLWKSFLKRAFPHLIQTEVQAESPIETYKRCHLSFGKNLVAGIYALTIIKHPLPFPIQAFTFTKTHCIIGSRNKIEIFSKAGKFLREIFAFPDEDSLKSLTYTQNDKLVACSSSGEIMIFDLSDKIMNKITDSEKPLKTLKRRTEIGITFIIPTKAGHLITGYANGKIIIWDKKGKRLRSFSEKNMSLTSLILNPEENKLIAGFSSGQIIIWDLTTGKQLKKLSLEITRVDSLFFTKSGHLISVYTGAFKNLPLNKILISDLKTDKILKRFSVKDWSAVEEEKARFAFLPNAELLITMNTINTVKIWDLKGNCLRSFYGYTSTSPFIFTQEGQFISSKTGKIIISDFTASNRMVFQELAEEFKKDTDTVDHKIIMKRFLRMPEKEREKIYELSGGKEAFDASSPEKKAEAIENYLNLPFPASSEN